MMMYHRLMTESLRAASWGQRVARVLAAALEAVEPAKAVGRHLGLAGQELICAVKKYDLRDYRRVLVVGAGKAGQPMAEGLETILGDHLSTGLVIVKEGHKSTGNRLAIEIVEAGDCVKGCQILILNAETAFYKRQFDSRRRYIGRFCQA